jgi:hypothetical protein
MSGHTWDIALDYLRLIGTHDVAGATDLLSASVDARASARSTTRSPTLAGR